MAASGHKFHSAASDSNAWSVARVSVEVSSDVVLSVDVSDAVWLDADVLADAANAYSAISWSMGVMCDTGRFDRDWKAAELEFEVNPVVVLDDTPFSAAR